MCSISKPSRTPARIENACASLQALSAGDKCRQQLQTSVQHLLALFAQPILDRVAQEQRPDFGDKYGGSYSQSQDTFMFDHNKVHFCLEEPASATSAVSPSPPGPHPRPRPQTLPPTHSHMFPFFPLPQTPLPHNVAPLPGVQFVPLCLVRVEGLGST